MKVAFLTNFIPPYRKTLYQKIALKVKGLKIFISTEMENNRNWTVNHNQLDVLIQKSWMYTKKWRHEGGYIDQTPVHIPYDTISQLKKYNPDVVISSELGIRSLLSFIYCKRYKKPLILWLTLSEHTEKNKKGVRILLRKHLLKGASAFLGNGKSTERYVASLGINKPSFNAPYTSDYYLRSLGEKSFNTTKKVLFTGQLIQRKGVSEMINAIKEWATQYPTSKIELIVAGNGPEKIHFKRIEHLPNIKCQLLGTLPYEKLQQLYDKADLYLFPTLGDEWGVVVNEALSRGTPVIGSLYSQAVEELITEDYNGWVFCPDNQQEFITTLNKAISTNKAEMVKISNNAILSIKNHTPENSAKNILQAINYVLN